MSRPVNLPQPRTPPPYDFQRRKAPSHIGPVPADCSLFNSLRANIDQAMEVFWMQSPRKAISAMQRIVPLLNEPQQTVADSGLENARKD